MPSRTRLWTLLGLAIVLAGPHCAPAGSSEPPASLKLQRLSDIELGALALEIEARRVQPGEPATFPGELTAEIARRGAVPLKSVYEAVVSPACTGGFGSGFARFVRQGARITIDLSGKTLEGVAVGAAILVRPPAKLEPMIGRIDDGDLITLISRSGSCSISFAAPASLHAAVKSDDVATVEAFINAGADLDQPDVWGPPLCIAVRRGSVDIVEILLGRGADIEGPTAVGAGKLHPLHIVASDPRGADLARLLIGRGAQLEARDGAGRTPLIVAVDADNASVAEVLLKAGADPNSPDTLHGSSPLVWAAAGGRLEVARLLLERGVDVNRKSPPDGFTPLHVAVGHHRIQIVPLLVRYGADVNAVNALGRTALDSANNEDMRRLLRSLGATD
jgi:ankyrin repeat protein